MYQCSLSKCFSFLCVLFALKLNNNEMVILLKMTYFQQYRFMKKNKKNTVFFSQKVMEHLWL